MTSSVARSSGVLLGELGAFADEIRLLKSSIDAVSSRLETLLVEIAQQNSCEAKDEGSCADAAELPEPALHDESEIFAVDTPAIEEAPVAQSPPAIEIEEIAVVEPAAIQPSITEELAPIEVAPLPEEPAPVEAAAPLPASTEQSTALILYRPRPAAPQKFPTALRMVGRWAAVAALVAAVAGIVAAGTGFAGFGEVAISNGFCSEDICSALTGVQL